MSDSDTTSPHAESPAVVLARWQDRLKHLMDEVKPWAENAGWRTRMIRKPIDDRVLGRHTVPVLLMEKDAVEVALNPVSPRVPGAEGAVDLYLVPAYDDIATLYFEGGKWVIHYSPSPPLVAIEDEPLPLSEAAIVQVLNAIASHAA